MTQDDKIKEAKKAGYTDAEISDFLSGKQPFTGVDNGPNSLPDTSIPDGMVIDHNRQTGKPYYAKKDQSEFTPEYLKREAIKASLSAAGVPTNRRDVGSMVGMGVSVLPLAAGPEGLPFLPGSSAAGEYIRQKIAGEELRPGRVLGSAATAYLLPGAGKLLPTALKLGGGSVVGRNVESLIDEGKPASLKEDAMAFLPPAVIGGTLSKLTQGKGAMREATAAENPMAEANRNAATMVDEGARIIPSKQNPTIKNKIMDALADPGQIAKATEIPNALTNLKMSLRAIGAKEGEFATKAVLDKAKAPAQAVYDEITALGDQGRKMSAAEVAARGRVEGAHGAALQESWAANKIPETQAQAGVDLKLFQEARDQVSAIRAAMNSKEAAIDSAGVPINLQKQLDAAEAAADQLKQKIIDGLHAIKRGDLADKFNFAQKRFAQVGEVERWANFNTGTVDPSKAFNVQNKTGKLTDELKTVADFRGAVGPSIDKELSRVSSIPGRMSRFGPTATAATVGTLTGGPQAGAGAASLVELMRYAALKRQLSDAVQKAAVAPRMIQGAPVDNEIARLLRYASVQGTLQNQ